MSILSSDLSSNKTNVYSIGENVRVVLYKMSYLNSVSYSIWLPGGGVADTEDKIGASIFLPEITARGILGFDAKALSDAFDGLGVSHGEYTFLDSFVYQGTCLKHTAKDVLSKVLDMIYKPTFPKEEIENIREACLQDLQALEDNPSKLVIDKLNEKYHNAPFNRGGNGTRKGILETSLKDIKALYDKYYKARVLIVLTGNFDDDILKYLEDYYSDKKLKSEYEKPSYTHRDSFNYFHFDYDGEQTQIAIASKAPSVLSEDYYAARLASELLSGGMFGKLFLEVREKRGLVYAVKNFYISNQYYGKNVLYAGTTPKNAKETLRVVLNTIKTLGDNLTKEEFLRAKTNFKSKILIQGESSLSRASRIAVDMWQLGKYREKEYIINKIDALTIDDIKEYLKKYPYKDYTIVSLGKDEISEVAKEL
ncbi:MAG: M16 family metallopeptidase [Bdellovibrionota bacterium]